LLRFLRMTPLLLIPFACSGGEEVEFTPAGAAASKGSNIILISVDSLRADHLGTYGYSRPTSPNIDALASGASVFERASSQAPWTLPSHVSLLTSLYPRSHQTTALNRSVPAAATTLAGELKQFGYRTHAIVSGPFMRSSFGMDRGFDHYDEDLALGGHSVSHRAVTSGQIHQRMNRLLDHTPAPFFLFLHYWDVHYDYLPPAPYDEMFDPDYRGDLSSEAFIRNDEIWSGMPPRDLEHLIALYDGEIRYADAQLGRLLAWLKEREVFENTSILVTSDHGEEFSDHGSMEGHQWTLYDEVLRVPLVLRIPGRAEGAVVEDLVDLLDLAPTLLESAGLASYPEFEGRSLRGGESQVSPRREPLLFSQIKRFNEKRAVRTARYKLIYTVDTGTNEFGFAIRPGFELFDLQTDPQERVNVYSERPAVARVLVEQLERWSRNSTPSEVDELPPFTDEERRMLEGLGYVE